MGFASPGLGWAHRLALSPAFLPWLAVSLALYSSVRKHCQSLLEGKMKFIYTIFKQVFLKLLCTQIHFLIEWWVWV